MQLTDKQRKGAWIAGGALVLLHFAPRFVTTLKEAWSGPPPAVHSKPSAAHPLPVPPPISPQDAQIARLPGIWTGDAVRPDEEKSCNLRLELRTSPIKPGDYVGYSTMTCRPSLALFGRLSGADQAKLVTRQMMPVSTILSGAAVNGAIDLHLQDAIGKASDGCQLTNLTLTPFGESNLAAKWTAAGCPGGEVVMARSPR